MPAGRQRSICYIAPDVALPFPTGASVHVAELASNLGRLGHNVHVIARRRGREEKSLESADGYTIHRVYRWMIAPGPARSGSFPGGEGRSFVSRAYYFYLRTVFAAYVSLVAAAVISRNRLDAIIERETAFGAGGLASTFTRRPLVLEIVGPRYSRLSAQRSSAIFYYTEGMLMKWVERSKCRAIEAGVNTERFRPESSTTETTRRSLRLSDSDLVVGYVGSFQSWHGIDVFVQAMSKLQSQIPALKAVLVGPSYEKHLETVRALGLTEAFRFTGPMPYDKIPSVINICDIMVAPYFPARDHLRRRYGIGWPIKVLEYMACGKPVITTKVTPMERVIEEGKTGLMVAQGDPEELAQAIALLAGNQALRNDLSSQAARIAASHSWSNVAMQVSAAVNQA